jgi:hypothetical protein
VSAEPVARPVVGFREWSFDDAGRLRPVEFGAGVLDAWSAGATRAACTRAHAAPDPACTCGLHARRALPARAGSPWRVLGAVVLWGRIVVHETGLRAAWARPVALLDEPGAHAPLLRRRAADRHMVPLLERGELEAYARWHGDVLGPARGAA